MTLMHTAILRVVNRPTRGMVLMALLGTLGVITILGPKAEAAVGDRSPADIVTNVEALLPKAWAAVLPSAAWQVGGLTYSDSAAEVLCEVGAERRPRIFFSSNVYRSSTDQYWLRATAHEYGHVVACYDAISANSRLGEWAKAVGDVTGAPSHSEMFAQCWARLLTGAAPAGYDFRCLDEVAWQQTLLFASEAPVLAPRLGIIPAAPAAPAAPPVAAVPTPADVTAMTGSVTQVATRGKAYTPASRIR